MSVIEGIGDEVVQFFSIVFVIILGVAAWWSTSIRESHHNIRTVLILERRSRNRTSAESQTPAAVTADTDNAIDTGQEDTDSVETELLTDDSQDKDESESANAGGEAATPPSEATTTDRQETSSNLNKGSLKTHTDALLTDTAPKNLVHTLSEGDQIRIRLKYLNDDQKLVEGRLQEQLGDFKRRHFSMELSADKLVRLIFNGQVLGSDQQTLQACGLYDNCVVHCLVHSQRPPPRAPTPLSTTVIPPSPPDWNLGTLLFAFLSLVLCLVWYCRYQYAQLFTLTTTVALIGLTGIFTVSIFSVYLPDQDGIVH